MNKTTASDRCLCDCSVRYLVEMGLRSVRLRVRVLGVRLETAVYLDQSQPAAARPRPAVVGIDTSRPKHLFTEEDMEDARSCSLCFSANCVCVCLAAAGDQKSAIIRWLSRSNANFTAPKISSSKTPPQASSLSSCS